MGGKYLGATMFATRKNKELILLVTILQHTFPPEERVNLSTFSPACLPTQSNIMSGQQGHISGGYLINIFKNILFRMGAGGTA